MATRPLADRIRPHTLDSYVGQAHLVGEGKPVRRVLETAIVPSMIFWGPPGVGKTTLARLIAQGTGRKFYELSAVSAGKDELRKIVEENRPSRAKSAGLFDEEPTGGDAKSPVLFLDEIHRFNKAQQDFLLPFVEDGTLILIGATTENPSFEVIPALLSRCRVFTLLELNNEEIQEVVRRGATDLNVTLEDDARDFIVRFADGDGRLALNLLQSAAELYGSPVTFSHAESTLQSRHLRYDKKADEHYNTISAFIKSMRAGNADAALYYLARMTEAGEDPKFIARRMVVFASEDVGLADPMALVVANAVFRAVEIIGYPECKINLGHGAVYLARAAKNRDAYDGIFAAIDTVKQTGNLPIPLKLRNAPTKLMKEVGYGEGYEFYGDQDHLPDEIRDRRFLGG